MRVQEGSLCVASMEPRPEGRGDAGTEGVVTKKNFGLQWSHGPKAVETPKIPDRFLFPPGLQWSHGPKAVETRIHLPR